MTDLYDQRHRCADTILADWGLDELSGTAPRLEATGPVLRYIVSRSGDGWRATVQLRSGAHVDRTGGVSQFQVRVSGHDTPANALQALVDQYGDALDELFGSRHPRGGGDE